MSSLSDQINIPGFKQQLEHELYESVIPFWERHSLDTEYGGYFNCLDYNGSVYDTRKHIWLQGRQAWMFAKLYRTVEQREEWLEIARNGIHFLTEYAIEKNGRVYFEMSREGQPIYLQRKIFSECFYIMALAEFARADNQPEYLNRAKHEFELIWEWSQDLTNVGRPHFEGAEPMHTLAIPMILLNLIEEIAGDDIQDYKSKIDDCIQQMLLHVHDDKQLVLENVSPEGEYLSHSYDGRLLNPGHAIEAGWFLQHWAQRLENPELSQKAADMIRWSFDKGWDQKYGGIFYFLDTEGYSPTQLEWSQKLWWPHTEALYATLQNLHLFGREDDKRRFTMVRDYTFTHFPDNEFGEWFGYLDRQGNVNQRFKGGPYKGCFHVPRALYLCLELLKKI